MKPGVRLQAGKEGGETPSKGELEFAAFEHHYANVNGVKLHCVAAGDGDLILFLHGFPAFWYHWRHQLAEFGRTHRAVAPDLRGFNLSDKPEGVDAYRIDVLVEDVTALIDHFGRRRCVVVGHDWGGFIAWAVALHHPERIRALVVLATSHPALLHEALTRDPAQQHASRFSLVLRQSGAGELLAAHDFSALEASMLSLPFYTEADRAEYRRAWAQPGALTAGANYYRAAQLGPPDDAGNPAQGNYVPGLSDLRVRVPTLMISCDQSPFVTVSTLVEGLDAWVSDLTVRHIPGAGHWLAEESPSLANQYIRTYLASLQSEGTEDVR